jgi:hypothetical protein
VVVDAAASNDPPVRDAPAMLMPLRKERRFMPVFDLNSDGDSVVSDDTVETRLSFVIIQTPVLSEIFVGNSVTGFGFAAG